MNGWIKTLAILNLLGALQGLLLAAALLSIKAGNRTANRLLAVLVATISILVTGAVIYTTKYSLVFPHLTRLHHPFIYLVTPLLYLYVRALTSGEDGLARRDWLHFIPSVLCAVYLAPYYFQSADYKIANLDSSEYEQWYNLRHTIAYLLALPYLAAVTVLLVKYLRVEKTGASPVDRANRIQVYALVISIMAVFVGGTFRLLLRDRSPQTNLLLPLMGSITVYILAYLALRKPESAHTQKKKYERSTLPADRVEEIQKRLLHAMENENLYLDGELTLQKLSNKLAIPVQHLSQIVNERMGQSFNDFINSYRVDEAKRRLLDPSKKHYSILAIAEEVGFNSKSTFNSAFKKHAGMTPSEYRDSAKIVEMD